MHRDFGNWQINIHLIHARYGFVRCAQRLTMAGQEGERTHRALCAAAPLSLDMMSHIMRCGAIEIPKILFDLPLVPLRSTIT
jgi:hypothetical protein